MIKVYVNSSWHQLSGNKIYHNGAWLTLKWNDRLYRSASFSDILGPSPGSGLLEPSRSSSAPVPLSSIGSSSSSGYPDSISFKEYLCEEEWGEFYDEETGETYWDPTGVYHWTLMGSYTADFNAELTEVYCSDPENRYYTVESGWDILVTFDSNGAIIGADGMINLQSTLPAPGSEWDTVTIID